MQIHLILIVNALACLVGGGLLASAVHQSSTPLQLGLAVGGLLIAACGWGWTWLKFTKGQTALAQMDLANPGSTGIAEYDQLVTALSRSGRSLGNSTDSAELAEIKELLEKLDRRKGGFDRDGNPMTAAERLRGVLRGYGREIDASVRRSNSCGRELQRAVQEIVSGSETQSDLMKQTTSAVEQLSGHIISVCDTAEQALDASRRARDGAERGLLQFQELAEDMKRIRNHVASRERKLQTLGQHTKDIESIVAAIGSLSSRTDLLALNASIESVRAGEHGRGFAVVAEEVRALAEQSAQAVVDITSRIEMVQMETHQSISGASGEHDQMHQVLKRVNDSLQSLEDLFESACSSTEGLSGIAENAGKQLELAQQVVGSLEASTDSSQRNRTHAEGANWTAKTLGEASEQLHHALDLFRMAGAISEERLPAATESVRVPQQPVSVS